MHGWEANASYLPRYVAGAEQLLRATRRTFPQSKIVWRLMHPGYKHSITPPIVSMFNAAVRAKAADWGVGVLDVAAMMEQLPRGSTKPVPSPRERTMPYGTLDGRHLHEWLNIALLNLLLNALRQTMRHARRAAVLREHSEPKHRGKA